MIKYYIGIDNGLNGGIVILNNEGEIISTYTMPVIKGKRTDYDVAGIVEIIREVFTNETFITLEKAHVRPISGKRACFMNGFGYGIMQGIIESLGFGYEIVAPKDWQKEVLKGMNTGDTKKDSIMFCKRRWPNTNWKATERSKKEHDGMTDAACMALYGLMRNRGAQ